MRTGTHHFRSIEAAERYYADYGYDDVRRAVARKIAEGEIVIGRPARKPGETIRLIDNGTPYEIDDNA